jgi:D-serine deaminase-like pyridoxal phosphate-dependent protein
MSADWFLVGNAEEIPSPALLVYPARVVENIRRMIALGGDAGRLRPHVKTNKMPEVTRLMRAAGITRFKCATIAEAEMTALSGAPDVLLAYQPVGPNVRRLFDLVAAFPKTKFSTIADNPDTLRALSALGTSSVTGLDVLLDIDCGQHRTGIAPGLGALELYRFLSTLPGLRPGGLHVYDGHIHEPDPAKRAAQCEEAFAPAAALWREIVSAGFPVPRVVAGGTPTFPMHARRPGVECSPGTCVFWDHGYGSKFADLDFLPSALVLTRVISKPEAGRLCLDLGHKAIGSEMPHPRVHFLNLPDAKAVSHSEEHLVVETARAAELPVGSVLYGVPWHICPTVNLHSEAVVVENGTATGRWQVAARERRLRL